MVEDLVLAAVNEAGRKVDAEIERLTQGMTSGLKIPGMR
jgi:DNA-binding protein YbaB